MKQIHGQGGQLIVEAILLMVVFFGISYMTATYFRDQEVLKKIVSGPWQALSGMLQNGVWAPPREGATIHPSGHVRHMALTGEDAK